MYKLCYFDITYYHSYTGSISFCSGGWVHIRPQIHIQLAYLFSQVGSHFFLPQRKVLRVRLQPGGISRDTSIITVSCSFSSAMSSECMYGYMWLHNYESLNLYHVYILCNLINTLEIHTCIYLWLPHIHTYICKQVWWLGTIGSMRRGREQ